MRFTSPARRGLFIVLWLLTAGITRAEPAPAAASLPHPTESARVAQPGIANAPKPARPTTETPRDGCVTEECHPGIKNHAVLHGPVHANACDSCHKLSDAADHRFEATRPRAEICTICHASGVPSGTTLHKPFAEGECLACHDPHGSAEPAMLRAAKYADSCKTCHSDVIGGRDHVHGPAAAGACGACHEPHASRFPKLLSAEGRDLCLRCHLTIGLQIENSSVVHKPVLGDCGVCHVPHATDGPGLLVSDPQVLCTGCHEKIAKTVEGATSQHAAVTTKRACLNCHSPHASNNSGLLKHDQKSLCLECHNTPIKLDDGTKLLNMKEVLDNGKSLHGAIADRSCSVCHEIHGGGHRRLLTNEYPSDLYYPFSENAYALCFSCHDRQLVALSRTEGATAFRNGDRNLHYAHVNRTEKGRSCSVCHDAHAANSQQHIRQSIPFGPKKWPLPLRYEALPDGGKCGPGCHAAFEYSRVNPIVYPAAPPTGSWKGEELVPGTRADVSNDPKSKAKK